MTPEPVQLARALTEDQAQRAAVVFEALARGLSLDDAERVARFVVDTPAGYDDDPAPVPVPEVVLEPAYEETVAATAPLVAPPVTDPTSINLRAGGRVAESLRVTRIKRATGT